MTKLAGAEMNYTDNRCFLDTNIFLYAIDDDSVTKQKIAQEIIKTLWEKGNLTVLNPF